jgi:hypothetical protein
MKQLLIFILLAGGFTLNAQQVRDFKKKDDRNAAERTAMLDLLREEVWKEINQEVVFVVNHLKVSGKYAWMEGTVFGKGGTPVELPEEEYDGCCYDCCHIESLFSLQNGHWTIASYGLFSRDMWYLGLSSQYAGINPLIFPEGTRDLVLFN